ncbi:DUF4188 domain-containing protein [Bacillus safensis]|uniref:DUF4188 domain-containing protein n=1 Tax=Bacillus safensis TaxID=561879 RepID=UPI002238EC15|nr:DUF4188 domain-containing protein [Bacillus safensis]MCW4645647.1 DUF4188 domain-containing protein [Bacillus safensis]MCY7565105.1 DUF4188 domain-containing protein [Bacillus safensis]MCY7625002.1 DUF4188 domain-containing protein [Bacillus safensis]MCY7631618.1 DUF4188 domain-containing protein [Bacillus safensis]MCY7648191.1 DUF4188 domain-containing protein [Bacillus safensis]
MKKDIRAGRFTTDNSDSIVVFIIGMRINKRWAIHQWLPVFMAMPGMIKELYTHQDELGFLGTENYFGLRTTAMIQYWKSTDDLLAYAKLEKHLAAWKEFNQRARNNDAVGIYHETYQIQAGSYESIYVNMPSYGLGQAKPPISISNGQQTAKERLNTTNS